MEAGNVVYYLDRKPDRYDFFIKAGICSYLCDTGIGVMPLEVKEHRYVEGIAIQDYPDSEWRKVPKDTWACDIKPHVENILSHEESEKLSNLDFKNPDEISKLYQEGLLVTYENWCFKNPEVDVERGGRKYRIICRADAWPLCYATDRISQFKLPKSQVFDNWQGAEDYRQVLIKEHERVNSLSDYDWSLEEISKVLRYFPEYSREMLKEALMRLSDLWDLECKKSNNKLLYRYFTTRSPWQVLPESENLDWTGYYLYGEDC